jgi:hypothetical protein
MRAPVGETSWLDGRAASRSEHRNWNSEIGEATGERREKKM